MDLITKGSFIVIQKKIIIDAKNNLLSGSKFFLLINS